MLIIYHKFSYEKNRKILFGNSFKKNKKKNSFFFLIIFKKVLKHLYTYLHTIHTKNVIIIN